MSRIGFSKYIKLVVPSDASVGCMDHTARHHQASNAHKCNDR